MAPSLDIVYTLRILQVFLSVLKKAPTNGFPVPQKQKGFIRTLQSPHAEEPHGEILRPGEEVLGVQAPVQRRHGSSSVPKRPLEVEGKELLPEAREPPDLNEIAEAHGDKSAIGDEAKSSDRTIAGHPVEDHAAADAYEEGAGGVVDSEEEVAVWGNSDAVNVG